MKFDKINIKEMENPHLPKTFPKDPLNSFIAYYLYNQIAIFILRPGERVNLKDMSNFISSQELAPNWVARISHINNEWILHIAPHIEINSPFSLYEKIKTIQNEKIQILGHPKLGIIQSKIKSSFEQSVNQIINMFKNIVVIPLPPKGKTVPIINHKFKLPGIFEYIHDTFDDATYKKYLLIINDLIKRNISEKERKNIIRISKRLFKNKILSNIELQYINSYADKYLTINNKVTIALKYLANKDI